DGAVHALQLVTGRSAGQLVARGRGRRRRLVERALDSLRIVAVALSALSLAGAASAQSAAPPIATPADVATPDAIIGAVYASISRPAGQPRARSRFPSRRSSAA